MNAAELGAVAAAARALIAYSDARDREMEARLAIAAENYAAGHAAGELAGGEAVHEWYAEQDRQIAAELAGTAPGAGRAEFERIRWHVCCRDCRRAECRKDCPRCEDRTRATFAAPRPDDYVGLADKAAAA